jgi:hypothetical protein
MADGNGLQMWRAIAGTCLAAAIAAVVWNFSQIESLEKSLALLEGSLAHYDKSATNITEVITAIRDRQSDILKELSKIDAIQQTGVERLRKIEEWEHQKK